MAKAKTKVAKGRIAGSKNIEPAVFFKACQENKTVAEISAATGLKEKTVETKMRDIRKFLVEALANTEDTSAQAALQAKIDVLAPRGGPRGGVSAAAAILAL